MRKTIIFLSVTVLVLSVLFIGIKMKNMDWGSDQKTIIYVPKSLDPSVEFWQVVGQGVYTAAKEFGVEVKTIGTQTEEDIEGQIKLLEEALEIKPSAVILAANDYNRVVPIAQRIVNEKINLVTVDSGLNGEVSSSFIGTNNYEAGVKAGQALIDRIDAQSTIAIINFNRVSATGMERERGVLDRLSQDSGFEILGPFYCEGSDEIAYQIANELLLTNPELDGIIGLNEVSTVGAARAVNDHKPNHHVQLIGFDSSMEEIAFLEEGVIQALVVQKAFNMGYLAVKTVLEISEGKTVSDTIDTGSEVITIENMYTSENQKLLFPFIEK
jgi:ribose transport system substrate-binding protein